MQVVVPYVKSKLDAYYTRLTSAVSDDGFENAEAAQAAAEAAAGSQQWSAQRLFIRCYPYLHAAYESWVFVYQCRYLFEFSGFWSPWQQLIGQRVVRMSVEDMRRHAQAQHTQHIATYDRIWAQPDTGIVLVPLTTHSPHFITCAALV